MKLLVTHEKPDFDALASLALAAIAHPGAVAAIAGDLSENVREFLHLYRDELDLKRVDDLDLAEVSELIVVDTNDASRLGPYAELARRVPVTVYDHHPRHGSELPAVHGVQEEVGATATLLTRHLHASNLTIPARIASLALLGIHEDTGNLTFDLTTADDYKAAAHLMACGASLTVVRDFQTEIDAQEQQALLQSALTHIEEHSINGYVLIVSAFEHPGYVRDAASVCNSLVDRTDSDGAILAVKMDGKTLVFARAQRGFDVGRALSRALDGGGHKGAAFARFDGAPEDAARVALEAMATSMAPAPTARDVMTTPVKSLEAGDLVREAASLLNRYGHNGAPVLEHDSLVGVISRRDLDRALRHDLGDAPVSGFMSREVVTASPHTTLAEIERLVLTHNIGRIPITDDVRLVGIVTRSDLLAAHHSPSETGLARKVSERLPAEARRLISQAVTTLATMTPDSALYLVGGTVRDALLGRSLTDLDLVVEGASAQSLVSKLQGKLGGTMSFHATFGTSSLALPTGLRVDIAGAREEYYRHPGALPDVTPSTIRKDLSRRDFTVNAMALRLQPEPALLIDPFGGLTDLEHRMLRTLHPLSFIEDPTRILRGARLAGRLGFTFSRQTHQFAADALESGGFREISHSRLRAELELSLAETKVAPALEVLDRLGALEAIFGLDFDEQLIARLDQSRLKREVPELSYLLALLLRTPTDQAQAHIERFHWPLKYGELRDRLAAIEREGEASEDQLSGLQEAQLEVLRVLTPAFDEQVIAFRKAPDRRKLRGRDVLELGLQPGPEVGEVLDEVARARQQGKFNSFEEELEFARNSVQARLANRERE